MNYLEIITGLHAWLQKHQITQKEIAADFTANKLRFKLSHPIKGSLETEQAYPETGLFRAHGIGLQLVDNKISVYDYGGIYDSIDNSVKGEHYSTTHFALLSAILFNETNHENYLECARKAIDFHLRTYKDEYAFSDWDYHWDFQNFAFINTFALLKDSLLKNEKKQWLKGLRAWKTNSYVLTNWAAMRACAYLLRSRLLRSRIDTYKAWQNFRMIRRAQLNDGCFLDKHEKSCPIQYHVFTLALMHRIYMIKESDEIKKRFIDGINFFKNFVDPDGDFNYYGRGHEQIFGYGTALYCLEAAKTMDPANSSEYQCYSDRVWEYLIRFKRDDGHFPLVLNDCPDHEKFGWYDYHHLTVYNAFLAVWLGLAHQLKSQKVAVKNFSKRKTTFNKSTQIVIADKDEYFLVLSGGLFYDYLSEACITFHHLYFREIGWIFSCPGGPSKQKFGKLNVVENVEKNVFSPIALDGNNNWIIPSKKIGKIVKADSDQIKATLNYGPFSVERTVTLLTKSITVTDNIYFEKNMHFNEFRYFNFPIVIDKFEIEIEAGKITLVEKYSGQKVSVTFLKKNFANGKFERLDKIKTAKGLAEIVSLREKDFSVREHEKRIVKYKIERISH